MPVFLSPSIIISEFDLSTIVQSLSTTEIAMLYTGNRGPSSKTVLTNSNLFTKIGKKGLNYTHFGLQKVLEEADHVTAKRIVKNATYGGIVFQKGTASSISSDGDIVLPVVIQSSGGGQNNLLYIKTKNREGLVTIPAGTYTTMAQLVAAIQTQVDLALGTGVVLVSRTGNVLTFTDLSFYGSESELYFVKVSSTNTGNAYTILKIQYADYSGTITIESPGHYSIGAYGSFLPTDDFIGWYVRINGIDYLVTSSDTDKVYFDATGIEEDSNIDYILLQKGTGGLVKKDDVSVPADYNFQTDELFFIYNENQGSWSEDVSVQVSGFDTDTNSFTLSVYIKNEDGSFGYTGESFTVSRDPNQKDFYGRNLYIETLINDKSNYIRILDNAADTVYSKIPAYQTGYTTLGEGADEDENDPVTDADIVSAWNDFSNPDEIFVTILLQNGLGGLSVWNKIISICESRMDCIGILDGIYGMTKEEIAQQTGRIDSSYVGVFYDWQRDLNTVDDKEIYLPPSVYVGNRLAYTDRVAEPWFATAGKRRGQIRSLGSKTILSKTDRDFLYPRKVNPIRDITGVGIYIWGSTTAQKRLSALSDLNVRRGLNILEQSVARFMEDYQWEFNDEATRSELFFTVQSYCEDLQRRRFMTDFKVICDSTNNTSEVINRKEIVIDILIRPSIAAQYGLLRIFVMKEGVSFETA